jgi:hypothetical protein
MSNPRYRILSTALALATASAGCGGSGHSQPPLSISERNATSVAAEALITTGLDPTSVQLPSGSTVGVAATLRSLDPGALQRLTALATGPQNADGTMTRPCAVSGTVTIVTAGTSEMFTYNNCVQDPTTDARINGTIRVTGQLPTSTPAQASLTESFNFTVTMGSLSVVESGGYAIVVTIAQNPSDNTEYELTGDSFSISLSVGGRQRDQATLSSFDLDISLQLTSTDQQVEHFTYDLDSSRLQGHVSVMTTQDLEQVIDAFTPRQFPSAGQVLISGANHTRLQITILGDETFTPPAGQGQIELQIDPGTGAFGAPIWTSWSDLSAMITGP